MSRLPTFMSRLPALLWLVSVPVVAVVALLWFGALLRSLRLRWWKSSLEPTDAGLAIADVRWTTEMGISGEEFRVCLRAHGVGICRGWR